MEVPPKIGRFTIYVGELTGVDDVLDIRQCNNSFLSSSIIQMYIYLPYSKEYLGHHEGGDRNVDRVRRKTILSCVF